MQNSGLEKLNSSDYMTHFNEIAVSITKKHDEVSNIETPRAFVKNKAGMDYVDLAYMRKLADKYYPGWSWEKAGFQILGDQEVIVEGHLIWFDNGVKRKGYSCASHRIAKSRETGNYVDISNNIKAANTDAMKKAFNTFMNIADDVYKKRVIEPLAKTLVAEFQTLIQKAETLGVSRDTVARFKNGLLNHKINTDNYDNLYKQLDTMIQEKTKKKPVKKEKVNVSSV